MSLRKFGRDALLAAGLLLTTDNSVDKEVQKKPAIQEKIENQGSGTMQKKEPREKALTLLELEDLEEETQNFVERNKKSVPDTLSALIKEKKFILFGEHHLSDSEPIRQAVALSLAKLQQEGLTHVALEVSSTLQSAIDGMNFSDPNIKKLLKDAGIGALGWYEGNLDILITAKRLGLKVVLIDYDDGRPDSQRENAQWQNQRDFHMITTLDSSIDDKSKVIIYIGSAHVHKKSVESYDNERVFRLGSRISEKYGEEAVSSIRSVNPEEYFDGLLDFMSRATTPKHISQGKNEVVVIPDQGPVKGDERVSAADYIVTIL